MLRTEVGIAVGERLGTTVGERLGTTVGERLGDAAKFPNRKK